MNHQQAKRYAADLLADMAAVRAGLIEGHYSRGESWDQLPLADGRRVVKAMIEFSEELRRRAEGRRLARSQPPVDPSQASLFEEEVTHGP